MVKAWVRNFLVRTGWGITRNLKYDIQTRAVLKEVLRKEKSPGALDVGCHKGEVLDLMLDNAPSGIYIGVEPIPEMAAALREKYQHQKQVKIIEAGLSDNSGTTTFQWVKNAPAYSGIKRRDYDGMDAEIQEISIQLKTLDEIWPKDQPLHLVKIDVEGGEYGVICGGRETLQQWKPVIIFEHGQGASDFYGTTPDMIWELLHPLGYEIGTMEAFLKNRPGFSKVDFLAQYEQKLNYYFAAYDKHGYNR